MRLLHTESSDRGIPFISAIGSVRGDITGQIHKRYRKVFRIFRAFLPAVLLHSGMADGQLSAPVFPGKTAECRDEPTRLRHRHRRGACDVPCRKGTVVSGR